MDKQVPSLCLSKACSNLLCHPSVSCYNRNSNIGQRCAVCIWDSILIIWDGDWSVGPGSPTLSSFTFRGFFKCWQCQRSSWGQITKLSEHRNALVLKHQFKKHSRWWKCYFRKSIQHHFQVHRYSRWKRPIRSFVHPSCQERIMGAIDIWICVSLSRCPLCSCINTLAADCSLLAASESHTPPLTVLRVEAGSSRAQLSKGQGKSGSNNFRSS